MFTGIIQAMGTVTGLESRADNTVVLSLEAPQEILRSLGSGGSLAVAGVCLTAIHEPKMRADVGIFEAVAMGETLARTSLGDLRVGSRVNLERCTQVGDRLDGHIVQGHVDGVGVVQTVEDLGSWRRLRVSVPERLREQVAEKGSVALDGVSLTVTGVDEPSEDDAWLEVALIPETLEATTIGEAVVGTRLNIETDVIAKYTARLIAVRSGAAQAAEGNVR